MKILKMKLTTLKKGRPAFSLPTYRFVAICLLLVWLTLTWIIDIIRNMDKQTKIVDNYIDAENLTIKGWKIISKDLDLKVGKNIYTLELEGNELDLDVEQVVKDLNLP